MLSWRATFWLELFEQAISARAIFSKRIFFSPPASAQATFSKRISFAPATFSKRTSFLPVVFAKTTSFAPAISSPHAFYELALFAGRLSSPSSGVLSLQPSDVSH